MTQVKYIIVWDNTVDQVCDTHRDALREAKYLRGEGLRVKVIKCPRAWVDAAVDMIEQGDTVSKVRRAIDKMFNG